MATINLSTAQDVTIKCKRGDTFSLDTIRFWSDAAKTIPIDISGDSFKMEVKDSAGTVILTFITPDNFTIHDTNELDITMPGADMLIDSTDDTHPYVYDIEWTKSGGEIKTFMKGSFYVFQDVTNA